MNYKNVFANYIGRITSLVVLYVSVPLYLNILDAESYGIIAAYTVLLSILALADVGLSATFAREAARNPDQTYLLCLLGSIEKVMLGFLTFVLVCASIFSAELATNTLSMSQIFGAQKSQQIIITMIFAGSLQTLIALYSAGLLGLQRQVLANIFQCAFVVTRSLLVVLPLFVWPDVQTFMCWQLMTSLLGLICVRWALVASLGFSPWSIGAFDFSLLKNNFTFASGMIALTLVAGLNSQLDKVLLGYFFSASEFAAYYIASLIAQVPVALTVPIAIAYYPAFTACLTAQDKVSMLSTILGYGRLIFMMTMFTSAVIFLSSDDILNLWVGADRVEPYVVPVTRLLVVGTMFMCLTLPSYYGLLAFGRSRYIAGIAFATFCLTIPLTYISVQTYGVIGAALPWMTLNIINFLIISGGFLSALRKEGLYARDFGPLFALISWLAGYIFLAGAINFALGFTDIYAMLYWFASGVILCVQYFNKNIFSLKHS